MEINQQQKDFMEANRPHYNTLVVADYLTNIGYDIKEGLLNIARVFAPGYQANLWCGPCVCDLMKYAYTQYDKWLLAEKSFGEILKDGYAIGAPIVEEAVDVIPEAIIETIIQKATFPKHDKPIEATVSSEDIKPEIKQVGKGRGGKRNKK